jgi:AraC-like DNA-binding protein
MDTTTDDDVAAPQRAAVHTCHLPVPPALSDAVAALVGVEMGATGPLPLAIAPHDALMLSLQFARGSDPIGPKAEFGLNTALTGIRHWTGSFTGAGDCVTLFALLTPLGAVRLLDSRRLDQSPRIRAPLAHLLDTALTRQLESRVALIDGLEGKLHAFGAWLEARAADLRRQDRTALRAARAGMRLRDEPRAEVQQLADEQCVSRRQLERDFERWLGVSPRHLAQVARVQGVARAVHGGATLAQAAADMGFADQPHMHRVVRRLTGRTPRQFVQARALSGFARLTAPIAAAFRVATGGGRVYL